MANDFNIPSAGEASDEIKKLAHETFIDSANKRGIDTSGFNPAAPLIARIQWALQIGLIIACVYTRFSTKRQGSTADQVVRCVDHGVNIGAYCPPEFICADEGVKGRKAERPGLDRIKAILKTGQVKAFLIYKLSRLARSSYRGVAFLREQVVGSRVRAISVTEAIDSANDKSWKLWSAIRGAMDEELLTAVGDHVRDSLIGLFNRGWTTGPVPAGYVPKQMPDLPKTRRGLPRTMPAIDEDGAPIIVRAFNRVAEGMGISEAWRLYRAEGGPVDPRSTTGQMSYEAFRRMLARVEYTGRWQICKTKCEWSDSRDSMTQVPQRDEDIQRRQIEELRILPDDLFDVVQSVLAKLEVGPRGPRSDRPKALWDLVTEVFHCASCRRRFYVGGAAGHAMRCPNPDCPTRGIIVRKDAVSAICSRLGYILNADEDLVLSVIGRSQELDADAENRLREEMAGIQQKINKITKNINALLGQLGSGDDEYDKQVNARLKAVKAERSHLQLACNNLQHALQQASRIITAEQVREVLSNFQGLLEAGAAGDLGEDEVHRAVSVFKALVGGRVDVYFDKRPGRNRTVVHGVFTPSLIKAVAVAAGVHGRGEEVHGYPIIVPLRSLPRLDAMAPLMVYLYEHAEADGQRGLGFRAITQLMFDAGISMGCGNVYASYLRWYNMIGKLMPDRRPVGRRPAAD